MFPVSPRQSPPLWDQGPVRARGADSPILVRQRTASSYASARPRVYPCSGGSGRRRDDLHEHASVAKINERQEDNGALQRPGEEVQTQLRPVAGVLLPEPDRNNYGQRHAGDHYELEHEEQPCASHGEDEGGDLVRFDPSLGAVHLGRDDVGDLGRSQQPDPDHQQPKAVLRPADRLRFELLGLRPWPKSCAYATHLCPTLISTRPKPPTLCTNAPSVVVHA